MAGEFEQLIKTIHTLRAPGGCPWDRKQNLLDASRYLLDEAAELVEAALDGNAAGAREELGDLLFMTCFCCEILGETEPVDMNLIAADGRAKLIRRHPHVFGDTTAADTTESKQQWDAIKAQEKRDRGENPDIDSVLKDLPAATAPLHQAYGYQKNAAKVNFDWPDLHGVRDKLSEEIAEVDEAISQGDKDAIEHEIGDVLFAVVNLARRLEIQPDMALRKANNRFRDRFQLIEAEFHDQQRRMEDSSLADLEAAWERAKRKLSS